MHAALPGPPPLAGLFPLLLVAVLTFLIAMVIRRTFRRIGRSSRPSSSPLCTPHRHSFLPPQPPIASQSKTGMYWSNESDDPFEQE